MPKIPYALAYKTNSKKKTQKYTLNQLEKLSPNSDVLRNLYCPVKGCTAKLVFHHVSHTRHYVMPYLSTWPNSHHKSYCGLRLHYIEGQPTSKQITNYIGNDTERLLRIAKYATKKMNRKNRSNKNNNRRHNNKSEEERVSKHQNGKSKSVKAKPSSDLSSTRNEPNRPVGNMRYYTPASIKSSNVIGTICLYGNLKDISLNNNRLILDIIRNNISIKVYSAPTFFDGQPELYSDLQTINELFKKKIIKKKKHVEFTGVVDVDVRPTGERYVVVNEPKFLRFPTIPLASFIYDLNHEK